MPSSVDESETTEPFAEDVKLERPKRLISSSPDGEECPESESPFSARFSKTIRSQMNEMRVME